MTSILEDELARRGAVIAGRFPELAGEPITWHTAGWHSIAADVGDRWIFKFPRHADAERALRREASLLAVVRPAVTLPVPALEFFDDPVPFSRHAKLRGSHLSSDTYRGLPVERQQALAGNLGRFYAELHAVDTEVVRAQGATAVEPWLPAEEILRRALPLLPHDLRRPAQHTIATWCDLPPDPHDITYGFFDGHGWNMAFDHGTNRLSGIYDFADSGFGPVHQEFIYSSFVAPDLTARIMREYERLTGRHLDDDRVAVLTGVHRLWELAALSDNPSHVPAMLEHVTAWAGHAWVNR